MAQGLATDTPAVDGAGLLKGFAAGVELDGIAFDVAAARTAWLVRGALTRGLLQEIIDTTLGFEPPT